MNTLTLKPISEEPTIDKVVDYPDYILLHMLRVGPSSVEADMSLPHDETIEFRLRERNTGVSNIIGRVPVHLYRIILARFSVFSGLENPYHGSVLFSCEFEREGRLRHHRFSLFLCNEPTMSYWLRLYLYSIEGVFPSFK